MVLNAYPAALGNFDYAIYVDTYLSPNVASRALQLAAREDRVVFLLGQPLFVAELLIRHVQAAYALPRVIIAAMGGYLCPLSLEVTLRHLLGDNVQFEVLHGYGVAEVDAGLFLGSTRTANGDIIYEPRADAIVERAEDGRLLVGIRDADGREKLRGFDTGDFIELLDGGGCLIRNGLSRLHPEVASRLSQWTERDWRRRTGYLNRAPYVTQLREGEAPESAEEVSFHEFAARIGMTWLRKPVWA
jgi:hypothetical protein